MDVTTKQQRDASFRVLSPVPRELWESLARSCGNLVATQALPWRDAVMASGAYKDVGLLYEFTSGRQVLLPMVQRRWRTPLEPTAASWPRRWGVGGPITTGGSIDPAEADAVLSHVVRRDMLGAEIHLSHIADPAWLQAASQYRVLTDPFYVLDLTGGFNDVWRHKFKSAIRRRCGRQSARGLTSSRSLGAAAGRLLRAV